MAVILNPYALPGLLAVAAAWTMAVLVYVASPRNRAARVLAVLLFVEGCGAAGGFGFMWSTDQADAAFGWQIVGMMSFALSSSLYPMVLSTLDTPLAKPFRSPLVQWGAIGVGVAAASYFAAFPDYVAGGVVPVWWAPWEVIPGPGWSTILSICGVVPLLGLFVAIDAVRRAPPSGVGRERARAYIAAFGIRDVVYGVLYFLAPVWFQKIGIYSDLFVVFVLPGVTLVFVLLLAYGMLRTQLFDIDLRLRLGVKRGTIAVTFIVVFFLAEQAAQALLSDAFGYVAGIAAAGLLLLVAQPLRRAADRVAQVAVPDERVSETSLTSRKKEIYKVAVQSAVETGGITPKERATLDVLREKLGLAQDDARAVERDAGAVAS